MSAHAVPVRHRRLEFVVALLHRPLTAVITPVLEHDATLERIADFVRRLTIVGGSLAAVVLAVITR